MGAAKSNASLYIFQLITPGLKLRAGNQFASLFHLLNSISVPGIYPAVAALGRFPPLEVWILSYGIMSSNAIE